MGFGGSKVIEILIIGLPNSGKTHFLDMLVYSGDLTRRPTIGIYQAATTFDGYQLDFVEYGGGVYKSWEHLQYAKTSRALYVFVDPHETPINMTKLHGYMMMQLVKMGRKRPICVILNGETSEMKRKQVVAHFQLRDLSSHGWPVRIVTLQYKNLQEWSTVVQIMLEWTILNGKE